MKKVYIIVNTYRYDGEHNATYIDGVFATKEKAEGWAESLYFDDDDFIEKEVEQLNDYSTTVRYFETEDGRKYWVNIVETDVQ